jgi:nucleoside transporter
MIESGNFGTLSPDSEGILPMRTLVMPRLAVMMFVQYFVWGAWYVSAPLFLTRIGFQGGDIGWTYAVGPVAGIISPFFVGMIADRFFATERVLGVLHLCGAGFMYLATVAMGGSHPSAAGINLILLGYMLCYFPTLALTNSISMHNLTNSEKHFPLIRVFGTIGWIVPGFIISKLKWDNLIEPFQMSAVASVVLGIYCFTLPHTPPPSKGTKTSMREILGLDALILLKRPAFLTFIVSSFLICIPLAFYYQLAAQCLADSGVAEPAFKMSFGQMSEIFFMIVMPFFFARLGVKKMLLVGMLAWTVRYALFAFGAPAKIEWMLLAGVVLHGVCYDFFFVTGQIYTDKTAPSKIRGQAQGMLVLFTLGLGMLIGAKVAGAAQDYFTHTVGGTTRIEWQQLWAGPAIAAAIVMVIFAVLFRDGGPGQQVSAGSVAVAMAAEEQP